MSLSSLVSPNNINKFTFESKNLEITIAQYGGSRLTDLNPGLEVKVQSATEHTLLQIGCNNFKGDIQTKDLVYKEIFSEQGRRINKLIKFIESIQNQPLPGDLEKLEKMTTYMSSICTKALSWAPDEETKQRCNICQFIIPGKRVNIDTFELEDAESKV